MPTSKLKNLTILILLLANLCLLAVIIPIQLQQARAVEDMRQSISTLYAKEDLTLDPKLVPQAETLYALQLAEDGSADLRAATALLGDQVLVQDDSTRYLSLYQSKLGQCQIGRSGSFSAELDQSEPVSDLMKASRELLRHMGFEAYYLGQPAHREGSRSVVQASQAVLGVPVFSDGLTLTYDGDRLVRVDGTFYTGAGHLTRVSEEACLSAADALVQFLSARFELGWVGSTVTSMEQGYLRTEVAAAATVHLVPVWRLGTDTGSFFINGLTGEVTAISG